MAWVDKEYKYSCLQRLALNIIKQGPVPKHVAFIMDGNRRHAVSQGLQKTEGHIQGFSKLSEVLRWCNDFGIKEVSVYAFSIENFHRPENEVSFLMDLASEKLRELIENIEELSKEGVRVRVIGNLRLLPKKVQYVASKVMLLTENNTKATLNIMMPYTTRDELTSALESIRRGVQMGLIKEEDISPDVVNSIVFGGDPTSRRLELMVRSSGVVRLSNFMIWQVSRCAARFSFLPAHWPALSFWHLAAALLSFQVTPDPQAHQSQLNGVMGNGNYHQPITGEMQESEARRYRLEKFYAHLERERHALLEEMARSPE